MIRVHIICEGQTEEMFINSLLANTFSRKGIHLYPSLLGKPGHKGGNLRIARLLPDIRARLLGDSQAYCTTFFDFYGLPNDFPGKQDARRAGTTRDKANNVLVALVESVRTAIGEEPARRFIPYVQMHEFEGLLFSDAHAFACGINRASLSQSFTSIRNDFKTPEDINNNQEQRPASAWRIIRVHDKRFMVHWREKQSALTSFGKCPLFNGWLSQIEFCRRKKKYDARKLASQITLLDTQASMSTALHVPKSC